VQTTDAGDYRVVISNGAGSVTSAVATLVVNPGSGPMTQIFVLAIGQLVIPNGYDGDPFDGFAEINRLGDVDEYQFTGLQGQQINVQEIWGDIAHLSWECLSPSGAHLWSI
jgi:hypothetical protein